MKFFEGKDFSKKTRARTRKKDINLGDYTESCSFKDCRHTDELGCAALEAVNNGRLDRKVDESYLKISREVWQYILFVFLPFFYLEKKDLV